MNGAACDACGPEQQCGGGQCASVGSCDLPPYVNFGTVLRGSRQQREFTVKNESATVRPLTAALVNTMGFVSVSPLGSLNIAPNAEQTFTVTIDTASQGRFTSSLRLSPSCRSEIPIAAEVIEPLLFVEPALLDFGFVLPTYSKKASLLIANSRDTPITISNFGTSAGFSYSGLQRISVPASSWVNLELEFKPTALGSHEGELTFDTDALAQRTMSVPLRGVGGGPKLSVATTFALGPTALRSRQIATLPVANVGTDADAGLHFISPGFSVTPQANTTLDEIDVEVPYEYWREGLAVGDVGEIGIVFSPKTVGPKSVELHLLTDDMSSPDTTVIVTTEAVATTPCTYTVSPSSVSFELSRYGAAVDLPVTITNTGNTDCTLLGADVRGEPYFSVPNFPSGVLARGTARTFNVRYRQLIEPQRALRTPSGSLTLRTNSSSTTDRYLPLRAVSSTSCLLVPALVDFGASPVSCRSAILEVPMLNVCDAPVTVQPAALLGSNEFLLGASSAVTIAPKSSHVVVAQYQPSDLGEDSAVVRFSATEPGRSFIHMIPLRGAGVAGQVTERFEVPPAKLDVLLAIDNSPSMVDEQAALASALTALPSNGLDVRFAATASGTAGANLGVFRRDAGLADLVQLGGDGGVSSCLTTAALALSDDYRFSAAHNAGFQRNDAQLAVMCVTDSPDSSPNPVAFELSRLSLVRPKLDSFSYNVIGPFLPTAPSGCTYDGMNDSTHALATSKLFGAHEEICSLNASVNNVFTHVLKRMNRGFTLTRAPDLTTAPTVTIDGAVIPSTAWTIDAVTGRLEFPSLTAPGPGQPVTVSYTPLCY